MALPTRCALLLPVCLTLGQRRHVLCLLLLLLLRLLLLQERHTLLLPSFSTANVALDSMWSLTYVTN